MENIDELTSAISYEVTRNSTAIVHDNKSSKIELFIRIRKVTQVLYENAMEVTCLARNNPDCFPITFSRIHTFNCRDFLKVSHSSIDLFMCLKAPRPLSVLCELQMSPPYYFRIDDP